MSGSYKELDFLKNEKGKAAGDKNQKERPTTLKEACHLIKNVSRMHRDFVLSENKQFIQIPIENQNDHLIEEFIHKQSQTQQTGSSLLLLQNQRMKMREMYGDDE